MMNLKTSYWTQELAEAADFGGATLLLLFVCIWYQAQQVQTSVC